MLPCGLKELFFVSTKSVLWGRASQWPPQCGLERLSLQLTTGDSGAQALANALPQWIGRSVVSCFQPNR